MALFPGDDDQQGRAAQHCQRQCGPQREAVAGCRRQGKLQREQGLGRYNLLAYLILHHAVVAVAADLRAAGNAQGIGCLLYTSRCV